jgi:hypothetical protein
MVVSFLACDEVVVASCANASELLDRVIPDLARIGALDPDQIELMGRRDDLIHHQICDAGPVREACPEACEYWRHESAQAGTHVSAG